MLKTREKRKLYLLALGAFVLVLGVLLTVGLRTRQQAQETPAETPAAEPAPTPTAVPTPAPTPTPKPTPDPWADDVLLLVNRWNPMPEDYSPQLAEVEEGYEMDQVCAQALEQMLIDCRAAGNDAVLCSAYRTWDYQQMLYDNKIRRLIREGTDPEEAPYEASLVVAVPGTSEHQLGLAADIIDKDYPILDEGQEETATQQWLMENCWRYGFILRYPNGTTEITGIIYEPWHYRYVGLHAAEEITRLGVTLEEYLEALP